jgi:hypothetical protein
MGHVISVGLLRWSTPRIASFCKVGEPSTVQVSLTTGNQLVLWAQLLKRQTTASFPLISHPEGMCRLSTPSYKKERMLEDSAEAYERDLGFYGKEKFAKQ